LINIFYIAYKNNNVALLPVRRQSERHEGRGVDGNAHMRDPGGDAMQGTCECGMTLERPSSRTGCALCGTIGCRSCSIEVEATHYCRWCATSLAHGQPA